MYPDRADYRYLVATGKLVRAVLVVGQLVADGSIALFSVDLDLARQRSRLNSLGGTDAVATGFPRHATRVERSL